MPSDRPDLLTLEQAASVAGVTIQTFRLYVASGNVKPEESRGESALFDRAQAERVARLQAESVEQARHLAVEKLAAELVLVRESLIDQAESAQRIDALEKAIVVDRETDRTELADIRARLDDQIRRSDADAAEVAKVREELDDLKSTAEEMIRALAESAAALDEQTRLASEQRKTIESLRADQGESRQRIDQLLDRLADAFFQVRSITEKPEPSATTGPRPPNERKAADVPPKAAVADTAAAGRPEPDPTAEKFKRENVQPAKIGVLREIEFNYLMERMGYRRLDSYTADELVEAGDLPVPDDDKIKDFLCETELGCDPDEVEIAAITRGDWQMIQYQRVGKRNNKRPWIGAKR